MRTRTETAIYRGLAVTVVAVALGTVLWPVLPGGHSGSPATICLIGMKGLGSGVLLYTADHDDVLPISRIANRPMAVGWAERISPFVRNDKGFADPVDKGAIVSYAMNANVTAMPRLAAIAHPERCVLLYEITNARLGRGGDLHSTLRLSPVGDGAAGGLLDSIDPDVESEVFPATGPLANSGLNTRLKPRHKGKSCFVRIDGSARALLPIEVIAGANAREPRDSAVRYGGHRPDLLGVDRPRARGSERNGGEATFSLR